MHGNTWPAYNNISNFSYNTSKVSLLCSDIESYKKREGEGWRERNVCGSDMHSMNIQLDLAIKCIIFSSQLPWLCLCTATEI